MKDNELCDDGNNLNGDGCSSACFVEANSNCDISFDPSQCDVCGNSKMKYPEICDDGNSLDSFGCSSDCMSVLPNFICYGGNETTNDICIDLIAFNTPPPP